MEMSKDIPPAEYPQLANNPPPPQQYQLPPGYDAQQYPVAPVAPVAPELQAVQVVVQQQPQIIHASQQNSADAQSYFVFSIVTFVISAVLCLWCIPSLICSIPALCFSINSKDLSSRGEFESARTNGRVALYLNIGATACSAIGVILVIIWFIAVLA